MKKDEIVVGGLYLAKVSDRVVTVRVDRIEEGHSTRGTNGRKTIYYEVTNLSTGRKTTFRSAAKFRGPAPQPKGTVLVPIIGLDVGPFGGLTVAGDQPMCDNCGATLVGEVPDLPALCQDCGRAKEASEESDPTAVHVPIVEQPTSSSSSVSSAPSSALSSSAGQAIGEGEQRSDPTSCVPSVTGTTDQSSSASPVEDNPFAALAAPSFKRVPGSPVAGMVPNQEQESIIEIAVKLQEALRGTGHWPELRCVNGVWVLVICAGAGTGKTATLKMLEMILQGCGQYTAFNKALCDESRTKFVTSVKTTYALAHAAVGIHYKHRLGKERVKSWEVAKMLGMTDLTMVLKGRGHPLQEGSEEYVTYSNQAGYTAYCDTLPEDSDGKALLRDLNLEVIPSQDDGPEEVARLAEEQQQRRNVFCDWLEDQGRHDHAEFVRNPCADLIKTLEARFLAGQVREAINRFCQSADPVDYISDHIWSQQVRPLGDEGERRFKEYLIPFVRQYWADLCRVDGKLPFDHINYVKMWQLGRGDQRPVIAADYILLDEAQDTPPVFLDILKQQKHALLILVGDDNQQIYEFLGAVNAMTSFKGAPRRLLAQSYRFGQAGADIANSILRTLDEPTDLIMRGNPDIPSRVILAPQSMDLPLQNPRCWLYRSNAGAISRVMVEFATGRRPHLIGGGKDTVAWCEAARDLQNKRKTSHPDLCCFENWQEVEDYSKTDEGADLKLMVKIVNQFGCDAIIDALKHMPKEVDADCVISTAHKSKGREWDTVRLGSDFMPANKMTDSERRLLYVAATRFKLTLDVSECPPFCGAREWENDPKSEWLPGLRVTYTAPMPTERDQLDWMQKRQWGDKRTDKIVSPAKADAINRDEFTGKGMTRESMKIPNGVRTATAGKYTWRKFQEQWCAQGPANAAVGSMIVVERKDGSTQTLKVKEVLRKFDDVWVYKV